MSYRSSVPLFWRLKKSRYGLVGTRCSSCGAVFFPSRSFCPECRRRGKIEEFRFSGNGEILSKTVIRVPPEGFEKHSPYTVAIIKLDEGTNVTGQVVGDPGGINVGDRVRAVFRKTYEDGKGGLIHYGLKWEVLTPVAHRRMSYNQKAPAT
jgi:uncharacterized OB-fold protein